jgi:hypothetical protein
MQDERVYISPQLSDKKRHSLSHQTRNEVYITTEAIQLRNQDRAALLTGLCERCYKLRPPV